MGLEIIAVLSIFLVLIAPVSLHLAVVRYLWHKDLRKAIADLGHVAEIYDVTPVMTGVYKDRRVKHKWRVKFVDGSQSEVFVPYRLKWYRTLSLDRGVKEIRDLRERNAELEHYLEDLERDSLSEELKKLTAE